MNYSTWSEGNNTYTRSTTQITKDLKLAIVSCSHTHPETHARRVKQHIKVIYHNNTVGSCDFTYTGKEFQYLYLPKFYENNDYLICSGNKIFNLTQATCIKIPPIEGYREDCFVGPFILSPNKKYLADTGEDYEIRIYSLENPEKPVLLYFGTEHEKREQGWTDNNLYPLIIASSGIKALASI